MLGEQREHSDVQFRTAAGAYVRLQAITPRTFRIRVSETEHFPEPPLVRYGIVRLPPDPAAIEVEEDGDRITIKTGAAALQADRREGTYTLYGADDEVLTRQIAAPHSGAESCCGASFRLYPDELLYGLGDETRDKLMKRGHLAHMRLQKREAHAPAPFLMSSRGWGLFIHTTLHHEIDIAHTDSDLIRFCIPGDQLDYMLFTGSSYADLLDEYTGLAGRPQLLPIWAYGLSFISNEQANARELIEDALKFRREGIPCDLIGLEPTWMEKRYDYSTSKRWHPERFYIPGWSPKGQHTFIGTLKGMGFKLSLWLCCNYDLSRYEEKALAQRHLAPVGGGIAPGQEELPDELDEGWYAHLKPFVDQGVSAFKLSEMSQLLGLPDQMWSNGMSNSEMNNLYPLLLAKQMYDGFRSQTSTRPMIFTVAGYAGIQRFASMWTGGLGEGVGGDYSLITLLNDSLSGISSVTYEMDIHTPEGIHFGFLQPCSKVNSWAYWRHPALLDTGLRDLFKKYAKLRYRLLPYIYSAAHTASRTGLPIVRAMPLMYPGDPRARSLTMQYMFGDAFLVAAFTNRVYLPEGTWIDYWTGERYIGPLDLEYDAPQDTGGPLFVKAGTILPMWPEMDHIGQKPVEPMSLHLYPHGESGFTLYEDDGVTFGYENGEFALTEFACASSDRRTSVSIGCRNGRYNGMPARRSYEVLLHLGSAGKPLKVKVNGTEYKETSRSKKGSAAAGWLFDRLSGVVAVHVQEKENDSEPVRIELIHAAPASRKSGAGSPSKRAASPAEPPVPEKMLEIGLETGDPRKTRAAMEKLLEERLGPAPAPGEIRGHFLYLSGLLARFMERKGWTMNEAVGEEYDSFLDLHSVSLKEEGCDRLIRAAVRVAEYSGRMRKSSVHPLVQRLKDMVEQEMDQQFFTLSVAAERLHVNASHLSRLFKQETSQSFSDYVMEKKMNYAKRLMEQGCKVSDASAMVGFKDTGYFIRVFRKYWGVTPGELKL
ncbi:TIM-barrel domain-containing protein [Paenibacillus sp. GCM10012303]|uniref:TIM-barrel domain-containing protein n=1 Tax=Paenibacillus sp. GCM10012303 TaxID=3317340 RepID=UPI0036068A26